MATVIGLSWVVASPAPTNASTYVAAQIDPDQMTRNAPRDLPSFEQNYQMHTPGFSTLSAVNWIVAPALERSVRSREAPGRAFVKRAAKDRPPPGKPALDGSLRQAPF